MKTHESIFRDILRLFIWFPLRWLISVIPVDWGFFLLKSLGGIHFRVSSHKKKHLADNLQKALNIKHNHSTVIIKKYFENHYLDRLHIFLYPRVKTIEQIQKYVSFKNLSVLENELNRGKGVLIVQPHFGPVQITLLALALSGYNPLQIGYPSNKGLSKIGKAVAFKYRLKYESFLPPIYSADKYLGAVYKHLLKGGVVLTTGDGVGGGVFMGEHRELDFLNSKRQFPLGPASLSLRTGASFIPTFIFVERFNRFRIFFEQPIMPVHENTDRDIIYITETFKGVTEKHIKQFPFHWHFWDEWDKIR